MQVIVLMALSAANSYFEVL